LFSTFFFVSILTGENKAQPENNTTHAIKAGLPISIFTSIPRVRAAAAWCRESKSTGLD
jgi:hypothetical protein